MARMRLRTFLAGLPLLAVAACGDSGSTGGADAAPQGAATAAGPANWNAADACSILGKADVAAILQQPVKETQLSLVNAAGGATAATSQCTYTGADGGSIATLMTRWSPIDDNTPETIAGARSAAAAAIKPFSDTPLEDVPGLGKAAFLAPPINQINVFIDGARSLVLTAEKIPDGANGKQIVIDLARKAGAS